MDHSMQADSLWDAIESHLKDIKRAATLELRNYPQPIAGCDAQIPALWEKRDGVAEELERCARARAAGTLRDAEAFLTASPFIDEDTARTLRAAATPSMRAAAE